MAERSRAMVVMLSFLLLMPSLGAGDEPKSQTPREQYEALIKEYESATNAWEKSSANVPPENPLWTKHYGDAPMWTFAPRFLQFAEANPREPVAVDALLKIIGLLRTGRISDKCLFPTYTRSLSILIGDHLEDEKVVQACFSQAMPSALNMEAYFRALLANSRDRDLIARSCMALVRGNEARLSIAARPYFDHPEDHPARAATSAFLQDRRDPDFIRYIRTADPVALSAETEALLERVVNEFGDVPLFPSWAKMKSEGRTLADSARRRLDALGSLAVGKVAPEIEGEDIGGKPMRLSDYRGNIVVLVFWGTWCGPCMRMVPHEKALVERLKDRPFALLGVNSDIDRVKLKAAIEDKGITWRSWWDGGKAGGPIANRWDVYEWPTVIVLDENGVIRFKRLPHSVPRLLDDAVDSLLKEMRP